MKKKTIHQLKDIPKGMSEQEVHDFWSVHEVGEGLLKTAIPSQDDIVLPVRTSARNISLRLDRDTEKRLKKLASIKHKGYQTLLKEFVLERLYEEEKRVGIL
jgi:hypothetical protein